MTKIAKTQQWMRDVGHRVTVLRDAQRVSQVELASALGITPQRLSNYERGARPLDVVIAADIADKLSGTLDYIYTGEMRGLPFETTQRVAELEGRLAHRAGEQSGLKN